MEGLLITLGLLAAGYFFGRRREKKHFESLVEREKSTLYLPLKSSKNFSHTPSETRMFMGSVVIGQDYFKMISSGLRSLVGGRMHSYESLIDRGRREAILRLKEEAIHWGAQEVINLRIETSSISSGKSRGNNQAAGSVEVMAYATAGK